MSNPFDILGIVKTGDTVTITDNNSGARVDGTIYRGDWEIYTQTKWARIKLGQDHIEETSIRFEAETVFGPCTVTVTGGEGLCLNCKTRHRGKNFCPNRGNKLPK